MDTLGKIVGSEQKPALSNSGKGTAAAVTRGKGKEKMTKKCKHCGIEVADIMYHLKAAHPLSITCNKCGKTVSDIRAHLESDHPSQKAASQPRASKNEDLVKSAVKEMDSQLQSLSDVKAEMREELKELRQDPKPKQASAQEVLREIRDQETLDSHRANAGPCAGLRLFPKGAFHDNDGFFSSKLENRPDRLVISEHIPGENLPNSPSSIFQWFYATYILTALFLVWFVGNWVGYEPYEFPLEGFIISGQNILLALATLIALWVLRRLLFFLLVCGQKVLARLWLPGVGYLIKRKAWRKFWMEAGWNQTTLVEEYNFYRQVRLVAVPIKDLPRGGRFFPDFDAEDVKYVPVFRKYQLAIEEKTPGGYKYSTKNSKLPPQWGFARAPSRLKTVVLSEGLISTTINRKTMVGARDDPAVNLGVMLRLISSNPHYAESPHYVSRGRSVYRDMALVCGAIVTRDLMHDNQHF